MDVLQLLSIAAAEATRRVTGTRDVRVGGDGQNRQWQQRQWVTIYPITSGSIVIE